MILMANIVALLVLVINHDKYKVGSIYLII